MENNKTNGENNNDVADCRNPDGTIHLRNPNIKNLKEDLLYHLALGTATHNLPKMFGDVKFVCMGGTASRMEHLAYYLKDELNFELPVGSTLHDLTKNSHRFSMYKVGPVLCVNHGMGVPSLGILLHEIVKLMYHAKVKNPTFFRIGTCGGIGLEEGTVVISKSVVDEMGNPYHTQTICGKTVKRPAKLDQELVKELTGLKNAGDNFSIVEGVTMCANDFYEGQGRTDGAFCDHTEEDKFNYLKELQSKGVKNIEMEATMFAAFTHYAGIRGALINVALVNRLKGDQVTTPKEILLEWQNHPQIVVGRYIKKKLYKL